jgi:hypothetical protein
LGEAYKTLDYLKDKNRTDLIAQTENIIDKTKRKLESLKN